MAPGLRPRFIWLVWLAAVTTTVVFAYAAWLIVSRGDTGPTLGWTEARRSNGWYVARVDPDGPANGVLQLGDRLLAYDGDSNVARAGALRYRIVAETGDQYAVRVERGGDVREHSLVVAPETGQFFARLSWFIVSLIWCGIGVFMGFVQPDRRMAQLAFLAAMSVGFVFIQVGVLRPGFWLWQPAHMVLGYHFFYRFPGGVPPSTPWTVLLCVLYAACTLPIGTGWIVSAVSLTEGPAAATAWLADHQTLMTIREIVGQSAANLALLGMVAVIPRNYRRLTEPDQRRRIRWVVYSSLVGLVPQFWYAAVATLQLAGSLGGVSLYGLAVNAATCTIPTSVAYAVIKHRLFDIKFVVRRGLQYLLAKRLLQVLLALPIAALAYTVFTSRNQTIAELVTGTSAYLYGIAALGLSLQYRKPVGSWLDRRFFREQYDSEQILVALVDELARVESVDAASRLATAQLERALHPKRLYLWFRETEHLAVRADFLTALDRTTGEVDVSNDSPELAGADSEWLRTLNVQLVVPIAHGDSRVSGVLMLGEKKSEEPYSGTDRRLLQAIARQIAVVGENFRLRAQVGEADRIRHEVLAHLDPRLANLLKECPSCGACFDSDADRCDRDGTTLTLSLPVDRTIDSKYRLDRLIGRGGMGAVYEAHDMRLDRLVAVKVLMGRAFGQDHALRRFQREARAAARLAHPNIVRVYDYGTLAGDGAYLVMERLHGRTLRVELGFAGVFAPVVAADWFEQLCDGVAAAHDEGIVHRDLKPENVMGAEPGEGPLTVKVLDFGLAKFRPADAAITASLSAGGIVVGTFGYMSPEQLLGRDTDARADIFALGVMVVEALTGARPFSAESYHGLLRAVAHDDYHLPGTSVGIKMLDDVLQRCLAKEPRDRTASVAELRGALIPALRACPPIDTPADRVGADADTVA